MTHSERLTPQHNIDYLRVERALRYLQAQRLHQPSLQQLSEHLELSPSHVQRLFQRWAGVSPKRFVQFLTREHARALLAQGATNLETARAVGLSGGGRLHDLMLRTEALTPGQLKRGGAGLILRYGRSPTPFGMCLAVESDRGLCGMEFIEEEQREPSAHLRARFPQAEWRADADVGKRWARRAFSGSDGPAVLDLRGRPFELTVWQALVEVPPGRVISYGQLARRIGRPTAARAVGTAVAANPVAALIPCHRVIHQLGTTGNYRWGPVRKRVMLAWEAARASDSPCDSSHHDALAGGCTSAAGTASAD